MNKNVKIGLQVVLVFMIFYLLSASIDGYILFGILIVLAFIFFGSRYTGRKSYTYYLDSKCDVEKYLEFVNKKLQGKDQSLLYLYIAYGDLYNGDFDKVENNIDIIDPINFKTVEKLMYEEIKLKLLYNNKDIVEYEKKLDKISSGEFENMNINSLLVLKIPLHLLKGEYNEAVDLLFEIIPKQQQSYRVIELEYYLSEAYIALGKEEDAIAILEIVTKRDFKLDHVVKGRTLLSKLQSN